MTVKGLIFDIKRDCSEDGPGIRTTVFFKGCPLRCAWCHNPEGIGRVPTMRVREERCQPAECGHACVAVCRESALAHTPEGVALDGARCNGCGECADQCARQALEPVGRWMTVEEVCRRVLVDRPFFEATGGGVTLSGGEPTLQMVFAGALLQRLKQEGVDTAIETCGAFNYARFAERMLPWLDRIYYDIKLMDDAAHKRWTGGSNRAILAHLARLQEVAGERLRVRVPLVPEVTTTEQNLGAIRRRLEKLGISAVELLPWNPLGLEKRAPGAGDTPLPRRFMTVTAQRAAVRALGGY